MIQTPKKVDSLRTPKPSHHVNDIINTFSGMKINLAGHSKRIADACTVEGSPVNARFKRQDINRTPLKCSNKNSKIHFCEMEKPSQSSRSDSLLIICSASEEHNTGEHQENALRTALLCGENGCLHREELKNHVKFINSDNLSPAPLSDLLRVHEYTYLRHLESKCKITSHENNFKDNIDYPTFYAPAGKLDADTPLQPQSLEAAKRFCGAAILAVDHVMVNLLNTQLSTNNPITKPELISVNINDKPGDFLINSNKDRLAAHNTNAVASASTTTTIQSMSSQVTATVSNSLPTNVNSIEISKLDATVNENIHNNNCNNINSSTSSNVTTVICPTTACGDNVSVSTAGAAASNSMRAFVIGRPPGHHAGPHGCVPSKHYWQRPDMTSSGFCLLNTVAVAAAYARHHYGRSAWRNDTMKKNPTPTSASSSSPSSSSLLSSATTVYDDKEKDVSLNYRAPRIAIVDIDVHHGNGTEEIIRNLNPHQVHLPLPSSWAPVSVLSYKPWLNEQDSDEVLFSSIHLYAGDSFYPCSGEEEAETTTCNNNNSNNNNIINITLTPIPTNTATSSSFRGKNTKLSISQREAHCKQAGLEFRSKVSSMLLPRLAAFRPDLLFISAGFDTHYDDMYHYLTEEDLHWVTEQLCLAANSGGFDSSSDNKDACVAPHFCGVISVLEGGYSLSTPIVPAQRQKQQQERNSSSSDDNTTSADINNVDQNSLDSADVKDIYFSTTSELKPVVISTNTNTTAVLGRGSRIKQKSIKAAAIAGIDVAVTSSSHSSSSSTVSSVPKIVPATVMPVVDLAIEQKQKCSVNNKNVLSNGALEGKIDHNNAVNVATTTPTKERQEDGDTRIGDTTTDGVTNGKSSSDDVVDDKKGRVSNSIAIRSPPTTPVTGLNNSAIAVSSATTYASIVSSSLSAQSTFSTNSSHGAYTTTAIFSVGSKNNTNVNSTNSSSSSSNSTVRNTRNTGNNTNNKTVTEVRSSSSSSLGATSAKNRYVKGNSSKETISATAVVTSDSSSSQCPHTMFAQRPGDGGLVKGVLAHTAALAGCKSWGVTE